MARELKYFTLRLAHCRRLAARPDDVPWQRVISERPSSQRQQRLLED